MKNVKCNQIVLLINDKIPKHKIINLNLPICILTCSFHA